MKRRAPYGNFAHGVYWTLDSTVTNMAESLEDNPATPPRVPRGLSPIL
jgi:hypothetical protein